MDVVKQTEDREILLIGGVVLLLMTSKLGVAK